MPATTKYSLPYPTLTDPADVPHDLGLLANALDPLIATASQGTASARPPAATPGRLYFATDKGVLYYDNGTTWSAISVPIQGPGALPTSPVNGEEVVTEVGATAMTAGVLGSEAAWRFRYNTGTSSSYKWEFVGGSPLESYDSSEQNLTPSWAYYGPPFVAPWLGDYIFEVSAHTKVIDIGYYIAYLGVAVTGTAGPSTYAYDKNDGGLDIARFMSYRARLTLGASQSVSVYMARTVGSTGGTAGTCLNRYLSVTPVRVAG